MKDSSIIKVRVVIDMNMKEEDYVDLDIHLVEAYRKFSETTKGNIISGRVEEQ